jgi:carbamoyltransferase
VREPVYILGISAYYHDAAACLLRDGEIVAAAQEERFTRKRHDAAYPSNAIAFCLREAGIEAKRLDHVCFYDKPVAKFGRILESHVAVAPRGLKTFLMAVPTWLRQKLWTEREITDALDVECEILFTEHHQAHAASAFFPSPFERAAVLTIDGVGEWATTSSGLGEGNKLELDREIRFPHSLGLLYSAFTYFCGFKVNSGEYKLMGLAPYGRPVHRDTILRELIDLKDDGSFRLDLDYFDYVGGLTMTNERFAKLFGGPPRKSESPLTEREMDLAASVQVVTEEIVLRLCRDLHARTNARDLCMAGGVALNCVANGKVIRGDTGFERLFVQPAAGDAGGAVGAAFATWHQYLGKERIVRNGRDAMRGGRLGPRPTDDVKVEDVQREFGAKATRLDERELVARVAERLEQGAVVAWCEGRMEFGPRALGGRSILGDPRRRDMQRTMNLKIKFRESFRPFAPSVLAEDAERWFDLRGNDSPYMLLTTAVKPEHCLAVDDASAAKTGLARLEVPRSTIPAVTHVDGSARVQTVRREDHPRYHALLTAWRERTGCPVIINTSFNVRGEPIVRTAREAYVCFMRTGMDVLVVDDWLFEKADQPTWKEGESWRETFAPD